ncbi:MAG TPA: hypothetical protein VMT03_15150 [Polyangia bacterium]|nr:hypothetical protein [Polyangia bacterium]
MTPLAALLAAVLVIDGGVDAGAPDRDAGTDAGDASLSPIDAGASHVEVPETKPPELRLAAPTGRMAGHVLAKGGREVVPDASLLVDGVSVGVSDDGGDFYFALACGPRTLTVRAAGFEAMTTTVDACAEPREPLTLRLAPTPGRARRETVVRAKAPQPVVRLVGEELTQTPGALGDPLRVIESLPGVAAVAWPAPVYAVRGSNPGNTGFFLDGIQIPALFHFALGPSVINPYFFHSLDFYPGGYPARYGRYVGGIATAETQAPSLDQTHMSVDVRLYDAGAMVSAPIAGGAVAVAARYSFTGELVTALREDIRLQYWDYQLRADRRFGPLQVTLLAFGSGDSFSPNKTDDQNEVDLDFHRVGLRASLPAAGGLLQGSVVLGSDHTRAPIESTYPITVDAVSLAPRLSYQRSAGPVTMVIGFDGQLARYTPTVVGIAVPPGPWDIAIPRDARMMAGYASATVAAGRLTLTPEIRLDTYEENGTYAQELGPRLTLGLALNDETSLQASGGRFTQLPSLPLQIPGVEAFGLKLLGLQTSWQGSVGVETSHFAAAKVRVTGFVQKYVLTDLRSPSASDLDPLDSEFLASRPALSYGVELLARRALTERLHGWLSYTLSNSIRSYGGGAVGPSDWDQRHIVNLVLGYRVRRYTLGARFHFNTGRPFFLQDPNADTYQRLPSYYQLDLRVDRPVVYDKFTLNLYAELVNATLTSEVFSIDQPSAGVLQPKSYRIVLPSIGARAEF